MLTDDQSPAEWWPYADGLRTSAIKHNLRCDTQCTTNLAQVLRVPGTLNHKHTPPRPVKLFWLAAADYNFAVDLAVLPPLAGVAPKKNNGTDNVVDMSVFKGQRPAKAFAVLGPVESLGEGIEREEMPPLDVRPIERECGFIREALATGGKEYAQPMWNLSTLAATFMEHGHALAHKMGNQHPGYTPEDTDALWNRKNREQKEKGLGWPSCNAIQAAGCTSCATCPHFGKIKSPLNFGRSAVVVGLDSQAPAQLPATEAASRPVTWSAPGLNVSFSNIRHRQWIYGIDVVRGELTVIGSPGGVGKSSLAIGMGISIATGTALLGEKIWGGYDLKVLIFNAEDGGTEIQRRVLAFCLKHGIAEQDLDRLYVAGADDARVQHISFLRTTDKNRPGLDQSGFEVLESALEALRPDVIILDPLGIALTPSGHLTFLITALGRPFTPAGFGNWFRDQCDQANLHHCSAHGLRKATAAALAEAGATAHEIAAVTGHTSLEEVERYTRAARKNKLADAAIAKLK